MKRQEFVCTAERTVNHVQLYVQYIMYNCAVHYVQFHSSLCTNVQYNVQLIPYFIMNSCIVHYEQQCSTWCTAVHYIMYNCAVHYVHYLPRCSWVLNRNQLILFLSKNKLVGQNNNNNNNTMIVVLIIVILMIINYNNQVNHYSNEI